MTLVIFFLTLALPKTDSLLNDRYFKPIRQKDFKINNKLRLLLF